MWLKVASLALSQVWLQVLPSKVPSLLMLPNFSSCPPPLFCFGLVVTAWVGAYESIPPTFGQTPLLAWWSSKTNAEATGGWRGALAESCPTEVQLISQVAIRTSNMGAEVSIQSLVGLLAGVLGRHSGEQDLLTSAFQYEKLFLIPTLIHMRGAKLLNSTYFLIREAVRKADTEVGRTLLQVQLQSTCHT